MNGLGSPTFLTRSGFRFVVFANDLDEPPHVHAFHGTSPKAPGAKFWLDPVELECNHGLNRTELRRAERIIRDNEAFLLEQWNDFAATKQV